MYKLVPTQGLLNKTHKVSVTTIENLSDVTEIDSRQSCPGTILC